MTTDGAGAIWNGHGVGHLTADGIAFAASIAYQTNVPKLMHLNEVLAVIEHHANNQGSTRSTVHEPKA